MKLLKYNYCCIVRANLP